jgi:predicted NBD/HSP70 family sugar kinase
MDYFAGLDISMEETHVCVVDRDGKIILEARTSTAPRQSQLFWRKGQLSNVFYLRQDAWLPRSFMA